MSKITKKELRQRCIDNETAIASLELILKENGIERRPQLKQLDQSVFDGLDEKWRFAAVDANGCRKSFKEKPYIKNGEWLSTYTLHCNLGTGYDASNWQNSLIERDTAKELLEIDLSSELTGSELCLKLLNLDRDVMCDVKDGDYRLIFAHDGEFFISHNKGERECHKRVTPINNQGEPLTASEVGL